MRHMTFFFSRLPCKRGCFLLACALVIFCLGQSAQAQSGRRPVKGTVTTPPPQSTEAEPKASTPAPKPAPVATLLVGGNRLSASFDLLPGYLDVALNACIERLEKSQGLAVNSGGSNMIRKDAIDAAKRQSESHVVWLEMKVERNSPASTEVVLEYSVYIPETAKLKGYGRVYLNASRRVAGGVSVGLPSVTKNVPLDYLAKEAGREVAERVLGLFRTDLPGK